MAHREARVDDAIGQTERLKLLVDQLEARRAADVALLNGKVVEGRRYAHAIRNGLQHVVSTLDEIMHEDGLTEAQRVQVAETLADVAGVLVNVDNLHALVRGLARP